MVMFPVAEFYWVYYIANHEENLFVDKVSQEI